MVIKAQSFCEEYFMCVVSRKAKASYFKVVIYNVNPESPKCIFRWILFIIVQWKEFNGKYVKCNKNLNLSVVQSKELKNIHSILKINKKLTQQQ